MISRFQRFILMNPFGNLKNVGGMYEVADFSNDGVIVLRESDSKTAVGVATWDEITNNFRPVKEKVWTPWCTFTDEYGRNVGEYKTNRKKVKVRLFGGYKSSATCSKNDEFNLMKGIRIAYLRARRKQIAADYNDWNSKLDKIDVERAGIKAYLDYLYEQNGLIDRMLDGYKKEPPTKEPHIVRQQIIR